jgi:hypothetical protein
MKKYFYLLMVFAITCFVGCKDKNAPSGEGYVGGVSTNISDYVGTWNVEGEQTLFGGEDKLLCVQLNADTSCRFAVEQKHNGIIVCECNEDGWMVECRKNYGEEVILILQGGGSMVYYMQYEITKTEPNKITLDTFNDTGTYLVRTSANTMQDYIDKYGDRE